MAEPRHTPPGDRSFLLSVGRYAAAALALIVALAGVFWAIGQTSGEDQLVVADGPTGTDDPVEPTTASPTDDATSPSPSESEPTEVATSPSPTETETPTATPSPTETGSIPPSEISVQVLDAVLEDGSTAAQEIADEMEADGYRIVVVNQASKVYDVTTVFYTAGFEDSARQIARTYGFDRVEEKPSNLSDTVRVHLVVGRDRS